jgi:hypothetical protein
VDKKEMKDQRNTGGVQQKDGVLSAGMSLPEKM